MDCLRNQTSSLYGRQRKFYKQKQKTMKQLLMSVVLMIGLSASAQQKYKATLITSGRYSKIQEKYLFSEYKPCGITFTFYNGYITADDNASSTYEIVSEGIEKNSEKALVTNYRGKDEAGRPVAIGLCYWKKEDRFSLNIAYDDYAFVYFIEKVE